METRRHSIGESPRATDEQIVVRDLEAMRDLEIDKQATQELGGPPFRQAIGDRKPCGVVWSRVEHVEQECFNADIAEEEDQDFGPAPSAEGQDDVRWDGGVQLDEGVKELLDVRIFRPVDGYIAVRMAGAQFGNEPVLEIAEMQAGNEMDASSLVAQTGGFQELKGLPAKAGCQGLGVERLRDEAGQQQE
jgi:hypothetical protein